MMYKIVKIRIPEAMEPYIMDTDSNTVLQRNALLLYPSILTKQISHGKAAEILGIHKLDLIELYGKMGLCYFDQTMDELDKELQTFKELGLDKVVL